MAVGIKFICECAGSHECPICQDPYATADKILEMPCLHSFHQDCVMQWLEAANTCPVCRMELKPSSEGNVQARDEAQQEVENIAAAVSSRSNSN